MGIKSARLRAVTAATIAFGAVALVCVPTAGFALGAFGSSSSLPDLKGFSSYTPASVDPAMARFVAKRGSEVQMTRFTPAGMTQRPNRSLTVAVRVNKNEAHAASVRSAIATAKEQVAGLAVVPARYNLGVARDYQNFAKPTPSARIKSDVSISDIAALTPMPSVNKAPSRFAARIDMDQEQPTGAAPRTLSALGDQMVGVAGSYRLTRNLDVTAGVRYSQDRDHLSPIAEPALKDSQAVYIGTQFRF